jgi:hypothetical protein
MRAARTIAKPRLAAHLPTADGTFAVLREIVAQLAERVELLEAHESLARTALEPSHGRRRSSS